MAEVVDLHPTLSEPKSIEIAGEDFVNISQIIEMARGGDTPQCRALTRFFNAEYRALGGSPLSEVKHEEEAFGRAWQRMIRAFGVPPIAGWDKPPLAPKS